MCTTLLGMIYYDEYLGMTYESLGLFTLGVFITLAGVLFLATRTYVREVVSSDSSDPLRSIIPPPTTNDIREQKTAASITPTGVVTTQTDDIDESRPLLYGSTGTQPPLSSPTNNGRAHESPAHV
jgi:hypothetical protein